MDLRKIAADLREARRYVRSDIVEARKQAGACLVAMHEARRGVGECEREKLERLVSNLAVGMRYIQVEPDLLRNYLANSAFELEIIAGPIEVPEVKG